MNTNTKVFFDDFTTVRAKLTGILGVYLDDLLSGFFRFERQDRGKDIPRSVSNAFGEVMIFHKTECIKVFDSYNIVSINDAFSYLMSGIKTLIGNMFMQPLKLSDGFTSAVRAFLSSRYHALNPSQLLLGLTKILRRGKEFAVGCSDKIRDAHIQTNYCAGFFKRFWDTVSGKADIVSVSLPSDDSRLDNAINMTVELDFDIADILGIELAIFDADAVIVGILDRIKSVVCLESWVSGRIAGLDSTEKSFEGFIQTTEGALA